MKYFPRKLSELVLSVLPKEDQKLYHYEHSDYYNWPDKEKALLEYKLAYEGLTEEYMKELKEFQDLQNESDESLLEYANAMALYESEYIIYSLKEILKPVFTEGCLTEEEYNQIIDNAINEMNVANNTLNESTPGPDMTYFMKGIGLTLGPLFTGIGALILAGKTKAAINSLKKYMNRVVETVDDGINKKRGFFATLGNKIKGLFGIGGKKYGANTGDQSISSLRAIQELFEGNIACKSMVLMKNIGMFDDKWDKALQNLENNSFNDGGFKMFLENIGEPVYKLTNKI